MHDLPGTVPNAGMRVEAAMLVLHGKDVKVQVSAHILARCKKLDEGDVMLAGLGGWGHNLKGQVAAQSAGVEGSCATRQKRVENEKSNFCVHACVCAGASGICAAEHIRLEYNFHFTERE